MPRGDATTVVRCEGGAKSLAHRVHIDGDSSSHKKGAMAISPVLHWASSPAVSGFRLQDVCLSTARLFSNEDLSTADIALSLLSRMSKPRGIQRFTSRRQLRLATATSPNNEHMPRQTICIARWTPLFTVLRQVAEFLSERPCRLPPIVSLTLT